jgi:hypothetical protein
VSDRAEALRLAALLHREFASEDEVVRDCGVCYARAKRLMAAGVTLSPGEMVCVLCCLTRTADEGRNRAVTVVNGNAACEEHIDRLPYGDLSRAIAQERKIKWEEAHRE